MLGDQVQNKAHIFFDFADRIVTNAVTTTVSIPQVIGGSGCCGGNTLPSRSYDGIVPYPLVGRRVPGCPDRGM